MVMNFAALREACCAANRRLPELGIVDLTFGNVSVCDRRADVVAIKPSGVPYASLQPSDIVVVRLSGGPTTVVVDGTLRPSSDTPTHRRLYQALPEATAIVHTHSRHATAFAQAGRPIPCFGTTHADYFCGEVPVTATIAAPAVAGDYEWETAEVILDALRGRSASEVSAVLVRHHGPFAWGPSAPKAVETAFALELVAQLAFQSLLLQPALAPLPDYLLDRHFRRKHGATAYYGQSQC